MTAMRAQNCWPATSERRAPFATSTAESGQAAIHQSSQTEPYERTADFGLRNGKSERQGLGRVPARLRNRVGTAGSGNSGRLRTERGTACFGRELPLLSGGPDGSFLPLAARNLPVSNRPNSCRLAWRQFAAAIWSKSVVSKRHDHNRHHTKNGVWGLFPSRPRPF